MKTKKSEFSYKALKRFTPCGSQTLSKMPERYINGVYPKVLAHGKGGLVYDVDGNHYVDLISGLGAISVGYANDLVNAAARAQMDKGTIFSLPTELEWAAAKRLTELVPWTDMWKFGKNGTDGTVMAVRAARAFTKRTKIMTVGYNGCQEMFECRGTRRAGIPPVLSVHNTRAEYNDTDQFENLVDEEYACVLMEPRVFDAPLPGFLEQIRELCTKSGTVLIFDEVVNGGRYEGFTSSAYYKVQPDLIVLSKGLANGFPICAVGGARRIMQTFERDDFFASGTFGGECVSLAALLATTECLQNSLPDMVRKGRNIQDTFNKLAWPEKTEAIGYPTRLDFRFPTKGHRALFWQEMCFNRVLVGYSNFVMADYRYCDVENIRHAITQSYSVLKQHWANPEAKLLGKMPEEALKKS